MPNIGLTYFTAKAGQPGFEAFSAAIMAAAASKYPVQAIAGEPTAEDGYLDGAEAEAGEGEAALLIRIIHDIPALHAAEALSKAHPEVRILCGHNPYDDGDGRTVEAWLGGERIYSERLKGQEQVMTQSPTDGTNQTYAVTARDGTAGDAARDRGITEHFDLPLTSSGSSHASP